MIEDSGTAPSDDPPIIASPAAGDRSAGGNWVEAIFGLAESRAAIMSLEAKDALNSGVAKFIPLAVCLFCVFTAWALTVAAAIGNLAACTALKWFQVAFAMAGLHLVIAAVAWLIAKRRRPTPFPVTRSEFEKDREWLIQLKNRHD